jgi:Flp pilus assembly protein TadG
MVELGITILLFLALSLGIVEFGRTLMIVNMITHAARDGARVAAVVPPSNRNPSTGTILNTSAIQDRVHDMIAQVMGAAAASAFTVNVTQPTLSGIPMVSVNVAGQVPYLFGHFLFGAADLSINRTVTFRDEGR